MRMQLNRYKVTAIFFILFIVLIDACTITDKAITKYSNYQKQKMKQVTVQTMPYQAENNIDEKSINEKLKLFMDKFKTKVDDSIAGKFYLITLNGGIHEMLGKKAIEDAAPENRVIQLNNGYLTFLYEAREMESLAGRLIELKQSLDKLRIPLLYIQAPFKIDKYDPQLPKGLKDTTNQNADAFLSDIHGAVDYIDLREEIRKDGIDHYAMFFKTDHHWKPEAAFWAYGKLRRVLRETYGFQIEEAYGDFNQYEVKEYKDYFLGSQGKRTGLYYVGTDDISLIYPKFETRFVFNVPNKGIERSGDFLHAMFDQEKIEKRDYFGSSPYHAYTGGDFPLNTIVNQRPTNHKKIVLIRDSFSCPLAPFLALDCEELDILDLRHNKNLSLLTYIEEARPDLVLVAYNPSSLNDTEGTFHFR